MGVPTCCLSFPIIILFSIFLFTTTTTTATPTLTEETEAECAYGIYIQTGSIKQAGTHSVISLTMSDASGAKVTIPNLEDWGLMGAGFNYFETGELNIFGGKGPCLTGPVCALKLTSDGSGPYHAWYCDYVEVTAYGLGKKCSQKRFAVEQWLAKDRAPYQLTAVRDSCLKKNGSDAAAVLSGI